MTEFVRLLPWVLCVFSNGVTPSCALLILMVWELTVSRDGQEDHATSGWFWLLREGPTWALFHQLRPDAPWMFGAGLLLGFTFWLGVWRFRMPGRVLGLLLLVAPAMVEFSSVTSGLSDKSVWGTGLWHASQAPELSWGNPSDEVLQSLPPQTSSTPPPSWLLPNQVFPTVLESPLRHQGLLLVCFLFGLRLWTRARRGIRGGALRVTPAVAVLGLGIFPPPVTTVFWEGGGTIWEGQLQMGGVWRPADGRFQAGGGVTEVQRRKEGGWAVKGGPWIAWTTPARTSSPLNLLELDAWAPWSWGEDPQDRGKWRRTSSGALFRFPRETQE